MVNTNIGRNFLSVFQLLTTIFDEYMKGNKYFSKKSMKEYPVCEKIIVLHRIDHSLHTVRIWILQESKSIAHSWNLHYFFLMVKGDISSFLEVLSNIKVMQFLFFMIQSKEYKY